MVEYVMEVLRPFRYWTLWMLSRHTVTWHYLITPYNDVFDHMDGVMRALAMKKTQWKEELFFAVMFAPQKLSKSHSDVTPSTGMHFILAHIFDPFWRLCSLSNWDKEMDIHREDETSYTTQYHYAYLEDVENEYRAKHRRVPVNELDSLPSNNLIHSGTASGSSQSSFDSYGLPAMMTRTYRRAM